MNSKKKYILATRGSRLALWQANFVKSLLSEQGVFCEIKIVKTKGDRIQDRFLHEIGGKGVFIKELEQELLDGKADLAIHSLKDLPVETPSSLSLSCFLPRHSASDALIINPQKKISIDKKLLINPSVFSEMSDWTIATGSLRRSSLLKEVCPNINVVPIRGNVDTRLNKLENGEWDAIILAHASLVRLSIENNWSHAIFDPKWFVPSASQGALVIETRENDSINKILSNLNCNETKYSVEIERKVLELLGGDCTMPIGVHVKMNQNKFASGDVVVLDLNGKSSRCQLELDPLKSVEDVSHQIIKLLKKSGVNEILESLNISKLN